MDRQKVVDGAVQYASYVVNNIPQKDENGRILYYLSGSLALLLLNKAVSFKSAYVDNDGKIVSEHEEIQVTDKSRQEMSKGIRQMTRDVDVVCIDSSCMRGMGKFYHLANIKQTCDLATELCPSWENGAGTAYFDMLDGAENSRGNDVAEIVLEDGTHVLIADPMGMIMHKLGDALTSKRLYNRFVENGKQNYANKNDEKYKKDIRDLAALFNAIVPLYANCDFSAVAKHIFETYPDTCFTREMLHFDHSELLKQFFEDAKEFISEENLELFMQFINETGKLNQKMLHKANEKE